MTSSPGRASSGECRAASVVSHALNILRCFSVDEPKLGVTKIATRVGLHKSTVSRLLATLEQLEQEDVVERDPQSRRYRLGPGLISMAGPLLAELEARRVAYPLMQELTERAGGTSALLVRNRDQAVCVEQIPSPRQIEHTTPLGTRYSTALSATVQLFLSAQTPERVRALVLSGAVEHPDPSGPSIDPYLDVLQPVRRDQVGVATPVFDHRDALVAAVMVAVPRYRVTPEQVGLHADACSAAALGTSQRLGSSVRAPGAAAGAVETP